VNAYSGDLNPNQFNFYQFLFPQAGGGIFFQERLSPSFNLLQSFSYDRVRYQLKDYSRGFDADIYNLSLQLKYKFNNNYILREQSFFQPYLIAGAGASFIDSHPFTGNPGVIANPSYLTAWRPHLQGGIGINFKINNTISIQLSNILNMPLDDSWDGLVAGNNYDIYLQHSAALVLTFKKANKIDSDHDGVYDNRDECPNTPIGTKVDRHGCPEAEKDSDGDGVFDSRDKCPNTGRGIKVDYFGCPVTVTQPVATTVTTTYTTPQVQQPQTQAQPQTQPIIVQQQQPVIIDTDGDGLPEQDDKCPTVPGPVSNYGCPEIKEEVKRRMDYAMHNINFETNSAVILKTSYPVLDDVVVLLNQFAEYDLRISGHTDSRGDDSYNNRLSRSRAEVVRKYFIEKGINASRIKTGAYGKHKPVSSNETSIGRAENRRAELEVILK
jgi:outer membrane protein OmpA-like peptidoglycan-associated protein